MNEERRKILQMVESGRITAEEGATLLSLVSESEPAAADQAQQQQSVLGDAAELDLRRPRDYWLYPFSAGLIVMLVGGTVTVAAQRQSRASLWTWLCGWMPLFLGLVIVTVAAWARTAHWIHLSVMDRDDRVSLSLPLPLRLTAWIMSIVRQFMPQFRDTGIDEAILALRDELRDGQPITLEVHNEEEGEHVRIRID